MMKPPEGEAAPSKEPRGKLDAARHALAVAWRRILGFTPLILSLAALAKCVQFSLEYSVDVPCSDGWPFVELHEKFADGTLRFSDLFAMHNEHLLFLPRVLFVLLGWATGVSMLAQTLLSIPELLGTLLVVWVAASRQFGFKLYQPPWWFVPIPFLVFNLAQARNLLCSFQSAFLTSIPLSLLAFYLLTKVDGSTGEDQRAKRRRVVWFSLAALSATLSAFSLAMGVCTFPVGVAVLLAARPVRKLYLLAWLGLSAAVLTTYVSFYLATSEEHGNQVQNTVLELGDRLWSLALFMLELLGSPLASGADSAIVGGVILSTLFVALVARLWQQRKLREGTFFGACALQTLMTCGLVAVGRVHLSVEYAMSSRYVTLVVPFWIACIGLAALVVRTENEGEMDSSRRWGGALLSASLCLAVLGTGTALLGEHALGTTQRKAVIGHLKRALRGRSGDKVYVERWRRVGVDLPNR